MITLTYMILYLETIMMTGILINDNIIGTKD
jgi:hypothetical protein